MKTGLVLEGGAMRGMYTVGVLDAFLEKNIQVDGIVGASAGALFGVNYLSKQSGRGIRYNKRFIRDPRYLGLLPLLLEGNIVSTRFAYHKVPRELDVFDDETFRSSGIPFYAAATDIASGQPDYFRIRSVFQQMDLLRASGSMPFFSKPVQIGQKQYLDGGIGDSIPYEWMSRQGYEKLIVILTRDAAYRKKPLPKTLANLFYRSKPNLVRRLTGRYAEYNRSVASLKNWEDQGKAFVVRPSAPIEIKLLERDPQKLQSVYDLGLRDGRHSIAAIQEYLAAAGGVV